MFWDYMRRVASYKKWSLFLSAGIPFWWEEIVLYNHFSQPKGYEKVN